MFLCPRARADVLLTARIRIPGCKLGETERKKGRERRVLDGVGNCKSVGRLEYLKNVGHLNLGIEMLLRTGGSVGKGKMILDVNYADLIFLPTF